MTTYQVIRFTDMVNLLDQVGDLTLMDEDNIEQINTLAYDEQFEAIESLYNDEDYDTAEDLLEEVFGVDLTTLNNLADDFGFMRIKD